MLPDLSNDDFITIDSEGLLESTQNHNADVLTGLLAALTAGRFGTVPNLRTILASAAALGGVAIGLTLALVVGGIDFSIAGHTAHFGVLAAWRG